MSPRFFFAGTALNSKVKVLGGEVRREEFGLPLLLLSRYSLSFLLADHLCLFGGFPRPYFLGLDVPNSGSDKSMARGTWAVGTASPPRREDGAPLGAAVDCSHRGDHHLGSFFFVFSPSGVFSLI